MTTETPTNNAQHDSKRRKLHFGRYTLAVTKEINKVNVTEQYECDPLTQEQIADGWQTVLPGKNDERPIHHWSVTMAQLPPHLWSKIKFKFNNNKDDSSYGMQLFNEHKRPIYNIIKDKIYFYSINTTEHDDVLIKLYNEVMSTSYANKTNIKNYLEHLDGKITGWLIIRAKKMLRQ
jgi:hypothetical protein